jgi:hypothetical protein
MSDLLKSRRHGTLLIAMLIGAAAAATLFWLFLGYPFL